MRILGGQQLNAGLPARLPYDSVWHMTGNLPGSSTTPAGSTTSAARRSSWRSRTSLPTMATARQRWRQSARRSGPGLPSGIEAAPMTDAGSGGTSSSRNAWDSAVYDESFGIITRLGTGVVDLLAAQPGERILDLGCGTGHLTAQIAAGRRRTIGIDSAEPMIAQGSRGIPGLRFEVARGEDFTLDAPVDAVFSSAVLHWIPDQAAVHGCVARALESGRAVRGRDGRQRQRQDAAGRAVSGADRGRRASEADPAPLVLLRASQSTAPAGAGRLRGHLHAPVRPADAAGRLPRGAADWVRMFGDDFLAPVPPERQRTFWPASTSSPRPSSCTTVAGSRTIAACGSWRSSGSYPLDTLHCGGSP